ncbi:protein phosphatase methylesterase 1 isoform X2 [Diprion similis]|uniref:protein phosphatase methylesterase 1 isoform X2 n=1 Tax=Diprion similis TaxID=362088 RepID=UPI001EF8726E|nr:protein phosphatase methylesterase 1 isoform X2 [Diprion similis]
MSSLQKSILKSKLPPSGLDFGMPSRACKSRAFQRKRDYDPVEWQPYFDESKDVKIQENTFHIYTKGNEGPILVLLHGGGFSALTWAEFTKSITTMVICKVMAIDLRGHGDSHTSNDDDLSADSLASDVAAIIEATTENSPVILVGHSMGGAVAVRAAPLIPNIAGMAVIDVVEGTAMDALTSMQSFLRSRPNSFSTIPQAIEWCTKTGKLATHDIASVLASHDHSNDVEPVPQRDDAIPEEEPLAMSPPTATSPTAATSSNKNYTWRIDLGKTEQHWSGWFQGLSAAFLNVSAPKMLLLAGVDRLDRELTVGQMQGKFQMQVLPACGHAVHEDVPDKVAEAVATFMIRHKFADSASDFSRTLPAY